ncbi:MAG: tetraacyldisaccharide 4'-kinase [Rubripirellula sp.]
MSSERGGPLAMATRACLRVASVPYRIAVTHRNRGFDSGKREIVPCGVPVICVGNLTTGGTGKTPIVSFIAKWFRSREVRIAIVSRGYGRGDADANDEAMELHARLPDVPHVQDADRVEAARIAVEELEAQVVVMDDGFQHRRLHRDLDIVVIDATCPFGFGQVLPRGLLREPIKGLQRADLVIVTRCDAVDASTLSSIEQTVRSVHESIPIIHSTHAPDGLLEYPDQKRSLDGLDGKPVCLVSAIGNPAAFEQTVRDTGANIIACKQLPDHDAFSPETVADLRQWIQTQTDAELVLCTHKDLVKLQTDRLGGLPLAALTIDLELIGDTQELDRHLEAIMTSVP